MASELRMVETNLGRVRGRDGATGATGPQGLRGVTFTPHIVEYPDSTWLYWTNDGNLPNPPSCNIRGLQGEQGEEGRALTVSETYPSVNDMDADFENVPLYSFVMIASEPGDPDHGKIFIRLENDFLLVSNAAASGLRTLVVEELPPVGEPGYLYLVPKSYVPSIPR